MVLKNSKHIFDRDLNGGKIGEINKINFYYTGLIQSLHPIRLFSASYDSINHSIQELNSHFSKNFSMLTRILSSLTNERENDLSKNYWTKHRIDSRAIWGWLTHEE